MLTNDKQINKVAQNKDVCEVILESFNKYALLKTRFKIIRTGDNNFKIVIFKNCFAE